MTNLANLTSSEKTKQNFFPTPDQLVEKMLAKINWKDVESVLEPSAGKGNLVQALEQRLKAKTYCSAQSEKNNIDCVEIDPYLQHILRGEGLRVVHDDFLTFRSHKNYQLIFMNPPFENGDQHLLKAIELQKDGGQIICLLNAETIKNTYTNRRKLLASLLKKYEAEVEYISNAFIDAERSTSVEVALIKLVIPQKNEESEIFARMKKAEEEKSFAANETHLTLGNFIDRLVQMYEVEVASSIELLKQYFAMRPHIQDKLDENSFSHPIISLSIGDSRNDISNSCNINTYLANVRMKYWSHLLTKKEFVGKLTSNLQTKYQKKINTLKDYEFSHFNINSILVEMNGEMMSGVKETIIGLFDKLSNEHCWYPECRKNIHYWNGWKSNKAHKISNKVIIPTSGIFSSYLWGNTFSVRDAFTVLSDIEKVFNYLSGEAETEVDLMESLEKANVDKKTKGINCKYFSVDLYKKGTTHIKFHSPDLVEKLNIYAAINKNWLPPCYSKKAYNEMAAEEKSIIDEFQGAAAYQKVLDNPQKFLYSAESMRMLGLTA